MGKILNTQVGEVNPNLYQAALKADLTPKEQMVYEQLMLTVKKAKDLRIMSPEAAKQEFRSLTPNAQEAIRVLYPNAAFAKKDPSIFDRAFAVGKFAFKQAASPLIATLELAKLYGKAINTPYLAARYSVQPNKGLWELKTWDNAFNGKDLFDQGAIDQLSKQHSPAEVKVAMGLLQGKTPGEIIEANGKIDENILAAITKSFDNPEAFKKVMDDVKYAQFSPGRDLLRGATLPTKTVLPESGGFLSRFIVNNIGGGVSSSYRMAKDFTGVIDFVYQIVADPLTWFTGGTSKLLTRGEKLAGMLTKAAEKGDVLGGVKTVFADKDVVKLWDEQAGPMLQKMATADAAGDKVAKGILRNEFGRNFPGLNNDEAIEFYIRNKMFDAKSAERKFTDVTNVHYLLSGRVDGISYTRNAIATAKNQRYLSQGRNSYLYKLFNPTSEIGTDVANTIDKLRPNVEEAVNILTKAGEDIDSGVNPLISKISDVNRDVSYAQRLAYAAGKYASRSPSGGGIITGENAIKTIDNFRLLARQVVDRDIADALAYYFLDSAQDERVIIIRNLYAAVMERMGLTGVPGGKALKDEILSKTFNNKSGMTTIANTPVNLDFAKEVSEYLLRVENNVPYIQARGIIHPYQVADMIAPLPYETIIKTVATKRARPSKSTSISKLFDGATRNKYVTGFTDLWTVLTLYPRLGIRSSIDEAFMYALTAPIQDLRDFALGKGRRLGKVATRFTGSKSAIGPIKSAMNKILRRTPDNEYLPVAKRQAIAQEISQNHKIPIEEVTHMMIREETVSRVISAFRRSKNIDFQYLKDVLVHNPDILNAMASSVGAKTSLSGRFDLQLIDAIFTPSMLTKALNDVGVKTGKKFRTVSTRELRAENEKWLTLAHFDAWYLQFVNNTRSLANGRVLDPATVFFSNDGLRTAKNFAIARTDILKSVGVEWDWATKQYVIKDPVAAKDFLSLFGDSVYFRQRGLVDADIARIHAETMLLDMRNTFHGGPDAFNENLYNLIRSRHNVLKELEITSKKNISGKWSKAASGVSFEDFENVTDGFKPVGDINTRIEFDGFVPVEDLPGMFEKFGNTLMEQMDRQNTGLFRQPAVMITYTRLRKAYDGFERAFAKKIFDEEMAAKPWANGNEQMEEKLLERAEKLAKKRYSEIAMNEAIDTILKYADNPAIRSNFAMSTRTVGRFYRATEDFWRRYYRLMKERGIQAIYRMRLAHQGLTARGEVYEDDKGDKYVVIPTDTVINSAVEPIVRSITGSSFKIPQFSDITFKLRLANPSFAPDAGQPALSGPFAGISMLAFKSLLGHLPFGLKPYGLKAGEVIDSIALGNIGENLTFQKAITPLVLQNAMALLPKDEQDRQETTAAFQAISYMQAFGYKMPDPNNPKEVNQFLRDVRIAAHNVLAARAILGTLSFIPPTLRESTGLPDYYKSVGITGFRSAFYDILEGIENTESDITDPYELAVATFVGKNPGRLIYTVSRNDNNVKVVIQKTKQVQDWAISNDKFISEYGDAAFIFAPQVGDFNSSVYAWLEANEFITQPKLEDYLARVQVAQAKQMYFDIEKREKEALSKESNYSLRKAIIDNAKKERALLKASSPLLQDELDAQGGFTVTTEEKMLANMEQALLDKNAPISNSTREKMALATKMVRQFLLYSTDIENRDKLFYIEAKRDKKTEIENFLKDLIILDPSIREANRAIFQPILDFYSRDTRVAVRR